ncbi:regucalcin isoform X4 [Diabrotica virgifera virgifera]|uniref:Regucalcin-like isoform X4 n=1 Tax=Diabrotica virgifera virgifera TaxID=50390 RepID=A0A6P7FHB9_DIAVI|nr:regucalcin isoform X4 [Diabrotica virgifera virgifera]
MAPVIEKVVDGLTFAESPYWDANNQCLYFVDLMESTVYRYAPRSKRKLRQVKIENHKISMIIPVMERKNRFIIGLNNSIAVMDWNRKDSEVKSINKLYEVDIDYVNFFTGGKFDLTGRLWAGTTTDYGVSGTNRQVIFSLYNHAEFDEDAICGGMTIDKEGNLWVAVFESSRVYKINPRIPDTVLQILQFPNSQITSITFGGKHLDELYVTSAGIQGNMEEIHGCVYRVTGLDVKGVPADKGVVL